MEHGHMDPVDVIFIETRLLSSISAGDSLLFAAGTLPRSVRLEYLVPDRVK